MKFYYLYMIIKNRFVLIDFIFVKCCFVDFFKYKNKVRQILKTVLPNVSTLSYIQPKTTLNVKESSKSFFRNREHIKKHFIVKSAIHFSFR